MLKPIPAAPLERQNAALQQPAPGSTDSYEDSGHPMRLDGPVYNVRRPGARRLHLREGIAV